jgi:hypothetical protein
MGREWEVGNAAESEVEARDGKQAIEELGNFFDKPPIITI